jgi:hypothetical protein
MANKTKDLSPSDLLNQLLVLPLEEKVEVYEAIKLNIQSQATALKETGDKAAKILETIQTNGK